MQETHRIYSKPIAPEDSRGSLTKVTIECTRLSLSIGDSKQAELFDPPRNIRGHRIFYNHPFC